MQFEEQTGCNELTWGRWELTIDEDMLFCKLIKRREKAIELYKTVDGLMK
jgi:hypothetical protein